MFTNPVTGNRVDFSSLKYSSSTRGQCILPTEIVSVSVAKTKYDKLGGGEGEGAAEQTFISVLQAESPR